MPENDTNQDQLKSKPTSTASIEDGIGIRLKAARESKRLSHSDLHRVTGLSRMVISKYESGQNKPGARELRLLCDALEISPNYLIYGTEEPHSQSLGLADTLLNMGASAVMPVIMIAPMLGAMLGRDDTRMLLSLIESLLKAKSPEDYASIMALVSVFKEIADKDPTIKTEFLKKIKSSPEAMFSFQQEVERRLREARDKANSK